MLLWDLLGKFPGTDYETFNWEWILKTVKEWVATMQTFKNDITAAWNTMRADWLEYETSMTDDWQEYQDNLNDQWQEFIDDTYQEQITEILEDHPEWVTTVMDGAITKPKINASFLSEIENAYVTPEMYGAAGNGVADDTAAVQAAVNSGKNVWGLGTYKISQPITISRPLVLFNGKFVADDSIVLFNITSDNVCIYNTELDGNDLGVGGIYCEDANNVFIEKTVIHNFTSSNTDSAQGIVLRSCVHCAIKDSEIFNINSDETNTNMCQAIEIAFCRHVDVQFCSIYDVECTPSGTYEADGIHVINDNKKNAAYANEYDIIISDCVFGTCTKRAVKIQQSGVIVQNCLIKEDAVNTQSWIACYYDDIIIRGCTILGASPIPICIGVTNTVYPAGSTLKNVVIEDCYIVNRSENYQGCITLINNVLENIIIRNNRLFSNSTVRAYGIVIQTNTKRSIIANNTFEKLSNDSIFTPFIFFQSTSKNTAGDNIAFIGNTAKTNDTFLEIADTLEYGDIIVSDNILVNENVDSMLGYRKYFVLYKNTTYVPTIKASTNIYPSGIVEVYPTT